MPALIGQLLKTVYLEGVPRRRWWVLDITETEKALARKIPGLKKHHRGVRGRGQSRTSWSHQFLVLGLLVAGKPRWHSLICSLALLWGRRTFQQQVRAFWRRSLPTLAKTIHTLVADRYFGSKRFLMTVRATAGEGVVRLKCHFKVCEVPPPPKQNPPGKGPVGRPRQ